MFINPTIEFLTRRAQALREQITDKDDANVMTLTAALNLIDEYDQLCRAMASITDKRISANVSDPLLRTNLWQWYCVASMLPPDHCGASLLAS